jgi:hypothetical protein
MQLSTTSGNTPSNGQPSPTVSVVIPTLNEERNLPHVFAKLPDGIDEVIVVDGGSRDRTVAVARELRPDVVIVQQTRTGKGNALACGFAACTGDIIVMIDADGSTDPAEGLNLVVNVLFGTRFTDLCYGYNAFWRRVVPTLALPDPALPRPTDGSKLWGDGFEIETMINIRAAADGMKVGEVGSVEHARIHGQSNLNTFRDGFRVLRTIFSEYGRMRRQRRGSRGTGVILHQHPTATPANTAPVHALNKVVNRPPVAGVTPAGDPRQHVAHLNRGLRRDDVGTRRTDDIKALQSRATSED